MDSCRHKNGKSGQKVDKNVDRKVLKLQKFTKYRQRRAKVGTNPDKGQTKDRQNINETRKSDLAKLALKKCGQKVKSGWKLDKKWTGNGKKGIKKWTKF